MEVYDNLYKPIKSEIVKRRLNDVKIEKKIEKALVGRGDLCQKNYKFQDLLVSYENKIAKIFQLRGTNGQIFKTVGTLNFFLDIFLSQNIGSAGRCCF